MANAKKTQAPSTLTDTAEKKPEEPSDLKKKSELLPYDPMDDCGLCSIGAR